MPIRNGMKCRIERWRSRKIVDGQQGNSSEPIGATRSRRNPSHDMTTIRPRDARDQYQRALGAPVPKVAADAKPKRRRVLRGIRPNAGIEAEYRERLERMIAEMSRSII